MSDYLTGETSDPSGLGAMLSGGGGAKARPQALGLQMGKALQLSKVRERERRKGELTAFIYAFTLCTVYSLL